MLAQAQVVDVRIGDDAHNQSMASLGALGAGADFAVPEIGRGTTSPPVKPCLPVTSRNGTDATWALELGGFIRHGSWRRSS
jgi:hypothetical protein